MVSEQEVIEALEELEEEGLVVSETDEDGETYYNLTDAGREYVEREILGIR